MKSAPSEAVALDIPARIRRSIAFSMCVDAVADDQLLTVLGTSLDAVEAVVVLEREFNIVLFDDDLLKLKDVGGLVALVTKAVPHG